MLELVGKFNRRLRRYGVRRTLQKTALYLRQRLGVAETGLHWDEAIVGHDALRANWYESPYVREIVRARICEPPSSGPHLGIQTWLARRFPGRIFERALSIGCGSADLEFRLVSAGLVRRFECFELGSRLVDEARRRAHELGLTERIEFFCRDSFEGLRPESYDLVLWNHSLHHMFDVALAVEKSRLALCDSGVLLAEEYVGPSRFQWSDANLRLMNLARGALEPRFFVRPDFPEEKFTRTIVRPTPKQVMRADPSEAVESAKILSEIERFFPGAEIRKLGGALFHVGLQGLLANFNEDNESDREKLRDLLNLDREAIENPEIGTHFAAILASKTRIGS